MINHRSMSAPKRIVTLDLGSQTIGLAEFRVQADGSMVLEGYRRREVVAEPAGEGMRQPQMAVVLREMIGELQVKNGNVNYAVTGQSVFVRFVNLPSVDEEKIERIISFEAQQEVPFPIDEVVWDYQLVGGGSDDRLQVVLVAIKADLLDKINSAIENTGLRTSTVDVAPMARYNAFQYSYSELSDCSLLVNIGAHTTNLLFIEPGKLFSRSVPIGGGSITAAIAKEFGESFAAAESRKKRDGFVTLGGANAEGTDTDIACVARIARSTMTRLHAELMRSISHYRTQQQGNSPARIFLGGGSASMPHVREFFQEKLQLPIEFFDPLRKVAVADSAPLGEIARVSHLLGELVGLALRTTGNCPMELNLAPPSVRRAQELTRRRPYLILAAACLVLGLLGWSAYYFRAAHLKRHALERLQEKVERMRVVETQIEKVRREITALESVASPLLSAIHERNFWPQIIEDLNVRLPKQDIWITELVATSGGKLVGAIEAERAGGASTSSTTSSRSPSSRKVLSEPMIDGIFVRGLYLFNPKQQEIVLDYFRNLVSSPYFKIDPNDQSRVIKPTTPNNTEWAFPYELQLDLRTPLRLP